MCGLPGFIPYVVWINLALSISSLITTAFNSKRTSYIHNFIHTIYTLIKNQLKVELFYGFTSYLYSLIIWPIIPWFICDIFFLLSIYFFPMFTVINGLKTLNTIITTGRVAVPHERED
jgi:hypothetical protein